MNFAVIGSGGREHAICYKLRESRKVKKIFCIPGNAGTQKIAENIDLAINNFKDISDFIKNKKIDLVIVGPEEPLVNGIVDHLKKNGHKVFGPDMFASQLEGSKAFMKELCKKNNIPTAEFQVFDNFSEAEIYIEKFDAPLVVKSDGLASGKGVTICKSKDEAKIKTKEILEGKFKSSKKVVLEQFLEGEELSYFVIADKNNYKFFGTAQDHKKVGEGDKGPNTGGMGAYSPSKIINSEIENKILKKIIEPTLSAMKNLGHPYEGFLYAGLMICKGEPYLIEYNIRMGDPECQVLMMRLNTDLAEIIDNATSNLLDRIKINWIKEYCMTIVLCSKGYPEKYKKKVELKNLNKITSDKHNQIFHAGTYLQNNKIFSNGGRVLNVTSSAKKLKQAREKILKNLNKINWKEGFFRKDIGWRVIDKNEDN